jgi:hypothetical protein
MGARTSGPAPKPIRKTETEKAARASDVWKSFSICINPGDWTQKLALILVAAGLEKIQTWSYREDTEMSLS